jgi:hypothetical protein
LELSYGAFRPTQCNSNIEEVIEPDLTTAEALVGLLWQRYQYLPLLSGIGSLCVAARLATILFLCMSNSSCRSFLFDHQNVARSAKSIAASVRAPPDAFLSLFSSFELQSVEQLLLLLWLLMTGAMAAYESPDRQWFVDGLVKVVDECVVERDEDMFAGDYVIGDVV